MRDWIPTSSALACLAKGSILAPTLGVNVPITPNLLFTVSSGYTYRGPYTKDTLVNPATLTPFTSPTTNFDPGDQFTENVGVTYQKGDLTVQLLGQAIFETNTTANGTFLGTALSGPLYRTGPTFVLANTVSYAWTPTWTTVINDSFSHIGKNQVLAADLPPLATQLFNSNSNVYLVGMDNQFKYDKFMVGPTVGYLYRDHNAWLSTANVFVPAKTKWTAGGFMSYDVTGSSTVRARLEHYWVSQDANPGLGLPNLTYDAWMVSFGATAHF